MFHREESMIFARFLFNMGIKDKKLSEYLEEFESFLEIWKKSTLLKQFVFSFRFRYEKKRDSVLRLFSPFLSKNFLSFVNVLIFKNGQSFFEQVFLDYLCLLDRHFKRVRGDLYSSIALDNKQIDLLQRLLKKRFARTFILKNVIDKKYVGGLLLRFDDRLIDLSVLNYFEGFRKVMLSSRVRGF